MNYEINFLILQSQTEKVDEIKQLVKKIIESKEGKITDELSYKKRKLAYEIKHEQYGFYTVYRFDIEDKNNLKEITKELNLLKEIARHLIVKSNELPALQKEIGKEPKTEEERRAEAIKNAKKNKPKVGQTSSGKTGKKVLEEISQETSQEPIIEKTTKEVTQEIPAESKTKIQKPTKKEVPGLKEKTTDDKSSKKDKKESEISMDDLDKKLDEILDI